MATCSSTFNRNEIMCPICLDVFIEPITLMCKHELCKECYEEHFQKADFRCPMCQKRLSSWARKASSKGSLVNHSKWKFIQDNHSDLIEKRLNGIDTYEILQPSHIRIAEKGEVHSEYLKLKNEWELEQRAQVDEEESASLNLIQQILKEEKEEAERLKQEQIERDKELAKVISEQLNQPVSPTSVGKTLLRSHMPSNKKVTNNTRVQYNSIQKYCVKKSSLVEKENNIPNLMNDSCDNQLSPKVNLSDDISSQPAKRCKHSNS